MTKSFNEFVSEGGKKHLAVLNGKTTHAYKVGGKWLVGGDYPQAGDRVSIATKHFVTKEPAWHQLKGQRLKYEDNLSDDEKEQHMKLQKESVEQNKPDHKAMRDFVYHGIEKTEKPHDQLKKEFKKKFGDHNEHHFDKHVSKYVD